MPDLPLPDNFLATPDRFLWHEPSATAILSDLHLGAEAELTRRGILMPDVSTAALTAAWKKLSARLAAHKKSHLIIAGDLFDVPTPDPAALNTALHLLNSLPKNCTITLIPGNHDPSPQTLAQIFHQIPLTITPAASVGGYTIIHGHRSQDARTVDRQRPPRGLIVGHQHPAVILQNRVQSAKMICYAIASLNTQDSSPQTLILLPTFSRAPLGSNLTEKNWLLDLPRPADAAVRILGIIDSPTADSQLLDFGTLAALRLPF